MELRKANFNDWQLLLEWRNDAGTRNNSRNVEAISEEQHKRWLEKVLQDKNRQLFIALENDEPVGTVRSDYDTGAGCCELSWTVAPSARGKGLGKLMVKQLAGGVKGKVMARVKTGNDSSIKIAEFAGLKLEKEEDGFLIFYRE